MFDCDTNDVQDLMPLSLPEARAARSVKLYQTSGTAMVKTGTSYVDQIAALGLGWTVSKVPLHAPTGEVWADAYGLRRDDTGAHLAVVGPSYRVLQNAEDLGAMLDSLFSEVPLVFRPKLERAVAFQGGKRLGLQARLPPQLAALLRVPGDDSSVEALLTLTTGHGGASVSLAPFVARLFCDNQFAAHRKQARSAGLVLRHTAQLESLPALAGQWLRRVGETYKETGDAMRAMHTQILPPSAVEALVGEILEPDEKKRERPTKAATAKRDTVIELIETRDGEFVPRGEVTRYSVLQAVTAFDRHLSPVRAGGEGATRRVERVWSDAGVASRAWDLCAYDS